MIIGTDLMAEMGLVISYSDNTIACEADVLPMREHGSVQDPLLPKQIVESLNEAQAIREATSRIVKIFDAKYSKANFEAVIPTYDHLSKGKQAKLYKLFKSYEPLFDGTIGTWNCRPVSLDVKNKCSTRTQSSVSSTVVTRKCIQRSVQPSMQDWCAP